LEAQVVEAIERSANVARVFLVVAPADEGWVTCEGEGTGKSKPAAGHADH
jgi:hypothetical protein